jgi:predicted NBD/HSP70 family sugar kinase
MNFAFAVVVPLTLAIFCRPTGWHGESGAAGAGGHITVDFYGLNNQHITTQHVYRADNAY